MHGDTTPLWLLATIAFILIAITIWVYFSKSIKDKVDSYFAQRRHDRRMRNYAKRDADMAFKTFAGGRPLYDVNTIRKPKVYNAPARHRR